MNTNSSIAIRVLFLESLNEQLRKEASARLQPAVRRHVPHRRADWSQFVLTAVVSLSLWSISFWQ